MPEAHDRLRDNAAVIARPAFTHTGTSVTLDVTLDDERIATVWVAKYRAALVIALPTSGARGGEKAAPA